VLGTQFFPKDSNGDGTGSAGSSSSSGASTASPSPTAAAAAGAEQWKGVLTLDDQPGGRKDLDPEQPVSYNNSLDQKNDFYGYFGVLRATYGAKASVWTDGGVPDYAGCAKTVDAGGTEEQAVKKGTILCVRTNEGRVGRLTVTQAADDSTTVKFDGVVWNLAE
jgi:hypothetical protein